MVDRDDVARAFIGSFTSAGGPGILVASVDPRTGALTAAGTVAATNPSYLALGRADGGPVLYAVSEVAPGAVTAYDVAGPVPRPLGDPVPVNGDEPTHLSVTRGHLLTANYGSGSVSVLPLAADGAPQAPSQVLRHEGSGPHPERQRAGHAHQVLPDPSGRWVLSVDLGTDSVRVCALDPATGTLTVHAETALPPGTGPRHLAFHPSGRHVYVLGELRPVVTVCRWDAAAGALEPVAEVPLLTGGTEGAEGSDGPVSPSAPVVSSDGRFLWVAVRGTDSIVVLALDGTGERAHVVASVPCGGHGPRDLVPDPSGTRLYVANKRSGDVTWFDVDGATGVPRPAGSLAVPAPSTVLFA
ncbi:lactonase family protein [Kitasatospora sp. NPDC056651]|uniref:lactonase family protein n=1 Tax=Kitasatospora sp. NPDC056651 TaxID=3345892 RepID=UPI0036A93E51